MAWTAPKTWTAVLVTVADLNTHIRDNLNILKTSINDDGTLKTLLDKSTTSQSVATNVLTTVYSFSVPGGTLKTGNVLRLVLDGLINATGSSQNFTWVATFGGTSIAGYVQSMTASTVGAFKIEVDIIANGATNLQNIVWRNTLPTIPGVNGVAGGGGISTYTIVGVYEGLTKDTTTAQTLAVTFQWASTDAADIAKRLAVTLEVLRTT